MKFSQDFNDQSAKIILPYFLSPDTVLPLKIGDESVTWKASVEAYINEAGLLIPPEAGISDEFELTAIRKDHEDSFTVRLLGQDSQWLTGYTRKPAENPDVYSIFLANSLHLALHDEAMGLEVLNHNHGILFPTADYQNTKAGETKLLRKPRLFRLHKDGFGILATPLTYEGDLDGLGELLYFETKDFVHYEEKGRIKLPPVEIVDYSCEREANTLRYRIGWQEEGGVSRYITTEDFLDFTSPKTGDIFSVRNKQVSVPDVVDQDSLALTSSEAAYLRKKLGRVRNIAVDHPVVTLAKGDDRAKLDNLKVKAHYSDGTTASKRFTPYPDEIAAIDLAKPGEYTVMGKVLQHEFPYPMMKSRPDPAVLLYKNRYYFISTDDDGQRKIYIRSAKALEDLADGRTEEVLLWDGNTPEAERHGQHWAPELHVIHDKLYCFLAISVNNDWHGVQAYVRVLEGDDPMNSDHWSKPKRVVDQEGSFLSDPFEKEYSISLDMTYFEHQGISYVCWSQPKWFGEDQERASLYLATVDPEEPWILTRPAVQICRNEYGWDRNGGSASGVSEGPFVLKHQDKLYMTFSGSEVGPRYAVGLLEMNVADDPMDPASWSKLNFPLMHSLSQAGQYGPGHNAFFQDRDGNWYNSYHACSVNGGHRHASIRPVHFRFDGTPILDMTDEEELRPEYKELPLKIIIE